MVRTMKEAASMGELAPRIRAGDKDRQRIVEKLGEHLGEGRLTVAEFDERVVRAHAAVYLDELPALMADLPADPVVATRRRSTAPPNWGSRAWGQQAAIAMLVALVLVWSVAAVVQGAPPIFALLLLFVFLKHRRWSRRW
jgi:hypothetical protein